MSYELRIGSGREPITADCRLMTGFPVHPSNLGYPCSFLILHFSLCILH